MPSFTSKLDREIQMRLLTYTNLLHDTGISTPHDKSWEATVYYETGDILFNVMLHQVIGLIIHNDVRRVELRKVQEVDAWAVWGMEAQDAEFEAESNRGLQQ